jgi:hypothetical protein
MRRYFKHPNNGMYAQHFIVLGRENKFNTARRAIRVMLSSKLWKMLSIHNFKVTYVVDAFEPKNILRSSTKNHRE